MFLQSIDYSQYLETTFAWELEGCTFGDVNLIVGQNATGKSKVLNIIKNLAALVSGENKLTYIDGNYKVTFDSDGKKIEYALTYEDNKIIKEGLDIDSKNLLNRGVNGEGTIYYEKLNQTVDFQTPQNELAAVARRDYVQHPFLEDLYNWGKSVRHYYFGTQLGKDHLAVFIKGKDGEEKQALNLKDTNGVVAMFKKGQKDFSTKFTKLIMNDMEAIGYKLDDIDVAQPRSLIIEGTLPGEVVGICVKENDLGDRTDQTDMSQGMFRALSLITQITYSQLAGVTSCILIDDIGEGLDYDRSSALVKLLVKRAKETSVQLIMATNDRFVMNNVPLEYWSVIQRIGGISRIYNYRNSPKLFDDFALTGLNNFDFFSSNYYLKNFPEK